LKHKDYEHIAKYPFTNFRHIKLGFKENNSPVPNLDLKLSASEQKKNFMVLYKTIKTICIFTFAADKCYPESWWAPFMIA
jgi:hypothetical protein